ncbi:hypothetical protein BCU93_13515 [Vibrio breoganii]|uniref:antirestriction protein ArdA n=1 Tax=Vibrio breoganii TaxID=553239 RepID=UPI000C81B5CD|nr:antirestriction protein ArdA [Vibrio breoganii]PMG38560.1 hypothetical protein BCU93_13515 [Vibrio breoganii]
MAIKLFTIDADQSLIKIKSSEISYSTYDFSTSDKHFGALESDLVERFLMAGINRLHVETIISGLSDAYDVISWSERKYSQGLKVAIASLDSLPSAIADLVKEVCYFTPIRSQRALHIALNAMRITMARVIYARHFHMSQRVQEAKTETHEPSCMKSINEFPIGTDVNLESYEGTFTVIGHGSTSSYMEGQTIYSTVMLDVLCAETLTARYIESRYVSIPNTPEQDELEALECALLDQDLVLADGLSLQIRSVYVSGGNEAIYIYKNEHERICEVTGGSSDVQIARLMSCGLVLTKEEREGIRKLEAEAKARREAEPCPLQMVLDIAQEEEEEEEEEEVATYEPLPADLELEPYAPHEVERGELDQLLHEIENTGPKEMTMGEAYNILQAESNKARGCDELICPRFYGVYGGTWFWLSSEDVAQAGSWGQYLEDIGIDAGLVSTILNHDVSICDVDGKLTSACASDWSFDFAKSISITEHSADNEMLIAGIELGLGDDLDVLEELYQGHFESDEEMAEDFIEACGTLDDMPENLRGYFNMEAFARDMMIGLYKHNGHYFSA